MHHHVPKTQLGKKIAEMNADMQNPKKKYDNRVEERMKQVYAEIEKDATMLRWSATLNSQ